MTDFQYQVGGAGEPRLIHKNRAVTGCAMRPNQPAQAYFQVSRDNPQVPLAPPMALSMTLDIATKRLSLLSVLSLPLFLTLLRSFP